MGSRLWLSALKFLVAVISYCLNQLDQIGNDKIIWVAVVEFFHPLFFLFDFSIHMVEALLTITCYHDDEWQLLSWIAMKNMRWFHLWEEMQKKRAF